MPSLTYRPAIDGLRAFAVLSVCIFHLNHRWMPGGFVGVDVFFVISGYLITSIIYKDCIAGDFSLARFYQRRIARIFPAFFTVALATMLGAWWIYSPQDLASAGANLAAASLSLANMKFMLQGNYFQISPDAQPFLHYWSLSVEEQFYMIYPLLFLLLFRHAKKYKPSVLGLAGIASLVACIILTHSRPVWAFYLLPTRAWELLAGGLLAVLTSGVRIPGGARPVTPAISAIGLLLIVASFFIIHEGPQFPGAWPILPVIGSVAVLLPQSLPGGISEKLLSTPPLVMIGKMSYSLYLWHWPVYSLVDYRMLLVPDAVRLGVKISLSLAAAYLSYRIIEYPSRIFLNARKNRPFAYAGLAAAIGLCVPLGISTRNANYVNAEARDIAKGGLVFPGKPGKPSVVLMGDSNGSMYGKTLKEICAEQGWKLTVLSAAGSEELPSSHGSNSREWTDALAVVEREKPDVLFLACLWGDKLKEDSNRLRLAIERLAPLSKKIVLLNEPPLLPDNASREAIRAGARPPFREDPNARFLRREANALLSTFNSQQIRVLDIASKFEGAGGETLFLDEEGRQLYHDKTHLSGYGADRIRSELTSSLLDLPGQIKPQHNRP